MRDTQLFDAYGDVKLGWIKDIASAELVVAIIHQTSDDSALHVLKVVHVTSIQRVLYFNGYWYRRLASFSKRE